MNIEQDIYELVAPQEIDIIRMLLEKVILLPHYLKRRRNM